MPSLRGFRQGCRLVTNISSLGDFRRGCRWVTKISFLRDCRKQFLCLLFLFSRSRKKDVVQDEPVSGRIGMEGQIGRFFSNGMLVIFGIVTSVKSPEALAKDPV